MASNLEEKEKKEEVRNREKGKKEGTSLNSRAHKYIYILHA
jgi:hypothetical protein